MRQMVERVARAIATSRGAQMSGPGQSVATREFGWKGDGEHLEQYVEKHWKEHVHAAEFAIEATPLADAIKAFEKISNFSDYEMGDGDGARQVADEWLERWKPEIDQALVELGPLRPAGTADLYGVPRAEE